MNVFLKQKADNIRRTWALLTAFLIVIIGLGFFFAQVYRSSSILVYAVIFSVGLSLIGYFASDKIALSMARAVEIQEKDNPNLFGIIKNLCASANMPLPRIYLTPDKQINAFATGRDPQHAAVAVTRGALDQLTHEELTGVLAHELSHVANRDILVSTIAVVLAGIVSLLSDMFMRSLFFGGMGRDRDRELGGVGMLVGLALSVLAPIGTMLIQLAISRQREWLADASGAELSGHPRWLASALRKIEADQAPMLAAKDSTAHLWISSPFKKKAPWWTSLFSTHPPLEERIARLERASE